MSVKLIENTEKIENYIFNHSVRDTQALNDLREYTKDIIGAQMQISAAQGQLMQVLLTMLNAKRVLELGTFTGYSALVMALALPDDGYVLTCDLNSENTDVAKRYWQEAGVSEKIELRLGPALVTLDNLLESGREEFDFVFIDADKANYFDYYEKSLKLIRKGGVIAIDNVLWSGKVAEDVIEDKQTQAIHNLNQHIHQDTRVNASIVPIGDGLTLAVKL